MTSLGTPEHLKSVSEVKLCSDMDSEVELRPDLGIPRAVRPRGKSYLVGWAQVVEELSWKLRSVSFCSRGLNVTNVNV